MNNMFTMNYEGTDIEMQLTDHAASRVRQRAMVKSAVYGSIVAALDFILDFKNEQEFAVVDEDAACTVVGAVHTSKSGNINIDIVTVIDNTDVFVKKGTSIVHIGERLKK